MALSERNRRRLRWIVYTLLSIPILAALILYIYARTGYPDVMARDRLVAALSDYLGRPVTVGQVELRYLPPGFVVTGFRSEHPLVEAPRMEVAVSMRSLLRGRLVVKDVDLYDPVIDWAIDTERLREPAERPERPERFADRVDLRRLRIHHARVKIGSEIRELSAEVEGLRLHADNQEPGYKGPWAGSVVFSRGQFLVGDFELDGVEGSFAFDADATSVSTRRLRLKAEGVDIRAAGQVQPGPPIRGRFEGDARLDPQSPSLGRPLPQITAKNLSCELQLTLPGEGLSIIGTFTVDRPAIDADRLAGPDGKITDGPQSPWIASQGSGTFQMEPGRIEVQAALTQMAGGSVQAGYVGVTHGDGKESPREHQVTISATQMDLGEVLRHFDLPGSQEVTPSALLSAEATVQWEANATDQMRGSSELLLIRAPGALPVAGNARVTWRGRRFTIEDSSLRTDGSTVTVQGTFDNGSTPPALDLTSRLVSTDTMPLSAFLERRFPALASARLTPSHFSGGIESDLKIGGTTGRPLVKAVLSSSGMTASLPRAPITLTAVAGTLDYRHDRIALDLSRLEGAELSGHGSLEYNPATGELLTANLEAASVPADLLARLGGLDPEKLAASGTLQASVKWARGEGQFNLSGPALGLGAIQLTGFDARAHMTDRRLHLDQASAEFCGGTLRASGDIDLRGQTVAGAIDFTIGAVDLAQVDAAYAGPSMTGMFDATGRLTFGAATGLEAQLTGTDIHLAGADLGKLTGEMTGHVDSTTDPLRLSLTDETGGITAQAELSGDAQVSGRIKVRGFNLDEVRPLLPPGSLRGLAGDADGEITINGPLTDPRSLLVVALLDRLNLTAGDLQLTSAEPVRLTMQDGFLTLAPMRLKGERTDLTLGGSMILSGTYDITARVNGTYDLGLAELIFADMSAVGNGEADLQVTERGDVLSYQGSITLENGRIRHAALPLPLENVRGRGEFTEQGNLTVMELLFDTGGGQVSGSGYVHFEGASVPDIHLALSAKGVRAEIFPEMKAFFDAEVSIDKLGSIYRLSGDVMIQRAIYTRAFGVAPTDLLLRGREYAPAKETRGQPPPQMQLNLGIEAEHDVWIRNDDALIEAAAHLRLEGTIDKPELSGRVSALEGGTYRFNDVTYRIVGGSIDFADLTRIDPLIDIEASTRVQSYEITLRIMGRYSHPIFELASDPPLPQRDVVWLLITGRTLADETSDAASTVAEGQVAAYLAAPMVGGVTAPIGRFLGVSSFQIDPFFLNGTADPSARVTVTKRLEQGLLFTVSSSLAESGQEVYQIEWNPGRIWDLIATRDMDGSVGADVRFRRRWKGFDKPPPLTEGQTDMVEMEAGRPRVGTLTIVADHLTDSQKSLIRKLKFDEGDLLRRGDLLEGRERLREHYVKRGYPSAHVELIEESAGTPQEPLTNVSYAIRAGARHDLVVNSEVKKRNIRQEVQRAWMEPILLEDLAGEARKSSLVLLKGKGYYTAQVDAATTMPAAAPPSIENPATVTLDVNAGPKVKVESIEISGNKEMPEERIRRQLLTRESGFMSLFGSGRLKEEVLSEDVDAIRGLYFASGYLGVRIAPPKVTLSEDNSEASIAIHITEEGPQSRIGDVVIEGEAPGVPGEELLKVTKLTRDQILTAEVVSAAADRVREKLDELGYSQGRVSTSTSGPPGQTRVLFSITPFDRGRIGNVTIEGNTRTRGRIVEREITVNHGDYLSRAALLTTQRNLYRLGVFRSVQVETTPVEGKPGFVDVKIKVQEGSPILTGWGIGYDNEDHLRGTFELANNNLFGTRRSAALFLRESGNQSRYQVTLRDPNLFGERIESLTSGFREMEDTESFDLRRIGASTQLSRKLGENTKIFGRYLLEDVNLFNVEVDPNEIDEDTVRLGSMGVSLAHDTRNDIINPRKGGLSSIDVRAYRQSFYSEANFNRLFISTSNFMDIGRGVVWASSARVGILASSEEEVPISERFFAGGDTTLRGFEYEEAGPVDSNGKPVGGKLLILINQELRFPIYKALRGVVFYDTGNVFEEAREFDIQFLDTNDLRQVLGAGFRFDTPIGPFRLEYGRKIDRKAGEDPGELFFSIGQAF